MLLENALDCMAVEEYCTKVCISMWQKTSRPARWVPTGSSFGGTSLLIPDEYKSRHITCVDCDPKVSICEPSTR